MFFKKFFDEGTAGGGGNSGDDDPSDGAGTNDGKTYTQEELNRMFSERARQAESSLLKKLGFEKPEELQSALKRLKTIDDGQKTELQKAQDKVAELEQRHTELSSKQKELITQYEVGLAAGKLGIVDPDAAYRLLDLAKLEYGEDNKPTNVEKVLGELVKSKPYLVGGSGSSAGNPRKTYDDSDPVITAARKAAGLPVKEGEK